VAGSTSSNLVGLTELLQEGVAVLVATRDEKLRPEIARGWHVAVEGLSARLCVSVPPGSRTEENLRANGAIAVTCSRPSTYRTVQLKGVATELEDPTGDQLEAVQRHLDSFTREVEKVGVRPEAARTFLGVELLSVTFEVREVFEQTPGPKAGERL